MFSQISLEIEASTYDDEVGNEKKTVPMTSHSLQLDNIWGVNDCIWPVKHLIKEMHFILKENVTSSGNAMNALRCLNELHLPHFHHEFVYEAMLLVMEDRWFRARLRLDAEAAERRFH